MPMTPAMNAAHAAAPTSAAPKADVVVLSNGYRLILLEDHSAPVVALQNWVRFGSADEEVEYAGVAHVFEHMLFKGSEKYPFSEVGGLIEGAGGNVNAWTSYDETVYHLSISSRYWEQGFDILADAVVASLFKPEELVKELEVVQEEIRRGKDNPDREQWERVSALAFTRHPYGRPVIGFPESVAKIDREAMLRIFHQWYVPNNMYMVAVGDFDRDRLVALVKERFGAAKKVHLPDRPRHTEPEQDDQRGQGYNFQAELSRIDIAFPGIAAEHRDVPALDLLSDLLGSGYNSILYKELKRKSNLVHEVYASSWTPLDAGIVMLGASLEDGNLETVVQALGREARRSWDINVSDEDLSAAKARIVSGFVHRQETYQGMATMLGHFEQAYGDPNHAAAYIAAVDAVDVDELRRVARTYLRPERMSVAALVPDGVVAPSSAQLIAWAQAGVDGVVRPAALNVEATDVESVSLVALPGGATLIVQTDRKAPLVSINATFDGGQRALPKGKEGLADLMTSVWPQGTSLKSASEIDRMLDRLGGALSAGADRDTVSIGGRFLREHLDAGLDLFFEILWQPSFPDKELEIERSDQLQELAALKEDRFRFAFQGFLKSFYGDHPYGTLLIGTPESVRGITRDDLLAYHRQVVVPAKATFAVVGDLSVAEATELVYRLLPGGFAEATAPVDVPPTRPALPTALQEQVLTLDGNQTHILWGFPIVAATHPDRTPLKVLDAILSGMGGRLFMQLRNEKSLAYAVTSFDVMPKDGGFLALYIGCAPDKEQASIAEFERVLAEISTQGVDDEELERAKRFILGNQDISLQGTGQRARAYAGSQRTHERWDEHRVFAGEVSAVTSADVSRVVSTYLQPQRSTRVILRATTR